MKLSDLSEKAFNAIITYSRFQKDLALDAQSNGDVFDNLFPSEEELLSLRESNKELSEEQILQIQSIIEVWESVQEKELNIDDRPILYDEQGFAYRLSKDYEGFEYREYIDGGI